MGGTDPAPPCPLTSLAPIWGWGSFPFADAEAGGRGGGCVSSSGGRAAAGCFWELLFIPGGRRERDAPLKSMTGPGHPHLPLCPLGSSHHPSLLPAAMGHRGCRREPVLGPGSPRARVPVPGRSGQGRVAWGSAPPPACPWGPLFLLPGPAAFPRATYLWQSTQSSPPRLKPGAEPGTGIPLARMQPWSRCRMGHLPLGYPACCLSRHGAAAHPISQSLPLHGFAMCLSRHPGGSSAWELGTLLLTAQGVSGR